MGSPGDVGLYPPVGTSRTEPLSGGLTDHERALVRALIREQFGPEVVLVPTAELTALWESHQTKNT